MDKVRAGNAADSEINRSLKNFKLDAREAPLCKGRDALRKCAVSARRRHAREQPAQRALSESQWHIFSQSGKQFIIATRHGVCHFSLGKMTEGLFFLAFQHIFGLKSPLHAPRAALCAVARCMAPTPRPKACFAGWRYVWACGPHAGAQVGHSPASSPYDN